MTDIEDLLLGAVYLWLADHPEEYHQAYTTTGNGFLRLAERIYLGEVDPYGDGPRAQGPAPWLRFPEREWGVYTLIDDAGRVLYVGMTGRPRNRVREHYGEFGERLARVEWDPHESRVAAYDAETALIRELQPPMNIAKVER